MIVEYLKPDYVHILGNKHIVKTGDYHLTSDIEANGYTKYLEEDTNHE